MMRYLLSIITFLAITGCPPEPMNPDPTADCGAMCEHWRSLDCKQAEPSPAGAGCEEICINVQSSGIISWNMACRTAVKACDEIDKCER